MQSRPSSTSWNALRSAIEDMTRDDPTERMYADVSDFVTGGQLEEDHGNLITDYRTRLARLNNAFIAFRSEMEAQPDEGQSEHDTMKAILLKAENILSELDGGDENNLFEPDLTKVPYRLRALRDATEEAFRGPDRLFAPTGGFWSLRELHKLAWEALGPHGQAYVVAKMDEGLSGYVRLSSEKRVLIDHGVVCMPGKAPSAETYKKHIAEKITEAREAGALPPGMDFDSVSVHVVHTPKTGEL